MVEIFLRQWELRGNTNTKTDLPILSPVCIDCASVCMHLSFHIYTNIFIIILLLDDNNRMKIIPCGDETSDYVNASPIDVCM